MGRKGKMVENEINSSYLNEKMIITWYLPEAFTPLSSYHVCIMQDGKDYFQLGKIATLSDQLHGDGEIDNTVFVGIHYRDRYDRYEKYHPNGAQNSAYIQFLIRELVPFLDGELPTYQVGGSRALMGDSLAGTLALMTATKYPNTFGKVIMQSPYVNQTVLDAVRSAGNLDAISFYHSIGTLETAVNTTNDGELNFINPNRELNEAFQQKQSDYIYREFDGDHTWKYWQRELPDVLKMMFGWD
ncbi:alpha/beta hydrolase [Aquibacillus rhizosphaerae]|uniref:Alpha/beta hydrolase-fold protein n=1 Tax=Aquibacillus rhizosphaerae TaxID=3051431 RepID=A0ABT7LAS1_9BACI|nr:alpha/beta hydrolase-fold protein [Aquibacillus sp. LR5S19]MDL4842958.1 alpha/beta hydrolase-fold protein [Aquibacillus sp. LR5S19]